MARLLFWKDQLLFYLRQAASLLQRTNFNLYRKQQQIKHSRISNNHFKRPITMSFYIIVMWHYESFLQQQPKLKQSMSPEIKGLKSLISHSLNQLENLQQQQQKEQENLYLTKYISILKNISKEVILAKQQYLSIDREKLIAQRKAQLGQSIIKTKGDINAKEQQLARLHLQLQRMDRQNRVGEFQIECLKKAVNDKQVVTKNSKQIYLTGCRVNDTNQEYLHRQGQSSQVKLEQKQKKIYESAKKQKTNDSQRVKQINSLLETNSVFAVRGRPISSTETSRVRQGSSKRKYTSLSYAFKYSKSITNFS